MIRAVKTKALISFAVTAELIFAFVFTYADCLFSHVAVHVLFDTIRLCRLFIYPCGGSYII